ncbi:S1 RNA-binding domain-containing protein [Brevibacillus sp. B_LB10_24]|uniref:CvfB family protein n=1 Tax=Brevibacillus sp. B_LB10_24 TaxID=3380645 RepID=UPI0038BD03D0
MKRTSPENRLQAGTVATMEVVRTAAFGYFLSDQQTEVLLHHNEATRQLTQGERVEVFLYHDHQNRLAATMKMPFVSLGEYGWLEVVDVNPRMGVYLHNGIAKDLLLFMDDLPKLRDEWPRAGDKLLVTLQLDKRGRLAAKLAGEEEIGKIAVPADSDLMNKWLEGTVYKVIGSGAFVLTEGEHILFVHRDEMTSPLRLGEDVSCRVSYVREDGRLNGSMRARKEQRYSEDAAQLLRYMTSRGGAMPYTDDTPAEIIKEKFGISKAAFKRALGKLLKERMIEQEPGWTHLKREVLHKSLQEQEETAE